MLLSDMIWLLFIDDAGNLKIYHGLATILLIRNQFGTICVSSDNF